MITSKPVELEWQVFGERTATSWKNLFGRVMKMKLVSVDVESNSEQDAFFGFFLSGA